MIHAARYHFKQKIVGAAHGVTLHNVLLGFHLGKECLLLPVVLFFQGEQDKGGYLQAQ